MASVSAEIGIFAVMNHIETLTSLAAGAGLGTPESVSRLAAAASSRRYYRLDFGPGRPTLIGAIGDSPAENRAFAEIARCLEDTGVAAPRMVAMSDDGAAYIVTDLGDRPMMDAVGAAAKSGEWRGSEGFEALRRCMESLPSLQYGVAERIDASKCYPRPAMDRRSVMWDLNHFKYCFLKAAGMEIDEEGLENDFNRLADMIEAESATRFHAFIHRDCQSRNVMLLPDGTPAWIDFQGGRMGPVAYDVASMVWHARAAIPSPLRRELLAVYVESLSRVLGADVSVEEFAEALRPVLLLRFLQVLGTYGLRGITEGKSAFIEPIAALVDELAELLPWMEQNNLPAIAATVRRLPSLEAVKGCSEKRDGLVVTVTSFSYKRGLPRDWSGNGGGFIFDCRYPNNPGRYPAYRHLTGRDMPVIDFIEADGEMVTLAERAIEMVVPAVRRYRDRGFTHLSVAFGCTGGQHRSVYGAEAMARALVAEGVKVHLIHREQGIDILL